MGGAGPRRSSARGWLRRQWPFQLKARRSAGGFFELGPAKHGERCDGTLAFGDSCDGLPLVRLNQPRYWRDSKKLRRFGCRRIFCKPSWLSSRNIGKTWGTAQCIPCAGEPSAPPCGPPAGLIKSGFDRPFRVSNAAARLSGRPAFPS